jgi:putative nucleotidyltransferase with HDIG domain
MATEPKRILPREGAEGARQTSAPLAIAVLLTLACLSAIMFAFVFPRLLQRGGTALFYLAMGILLVLVVTYLAGYFITIKHPHRVSDPKVAVARPLAVFIRVYIIVSLLPLVCIAMLLMMYIIPELITHTDPTLLYALVGVICASFLLSLLGYFQTRRRMLASLTALDRSRSNLEQLVAISGAVSQSPQPQEVYNRIVQGAMQLFRVTGAYLFVPAGDECKIIAEMGPTIEESGGEHLAYYRAVTHRAAEAKEALLFDGETLRGGPLAYAPGRIQVAAAPLETGETLKGVLVLVHKLQDAGSFDRAELDILQTLTSQAAISVQNAEFREVQLNYFTHTIELLVQSLEGTIVARDHLRNVARYASMVARRLNMDEAERKRLYFAALLHDIGMVKVPADSKHDPESHRRHPLLGAELVSRIILWQDLVPLIEYHHENLDGTGYPAGLASDAIPLGARIIAIAESFDAMTNPHSYQIRRSFDEAFADLRRKAGSRYDPKLVDIFETELRAQAE